MGIFSIFNSGNLRITDIAQKTATSIKTHAQVFKIDTSMDYKMSNSEVKKIIKSYEITMKIIIDSAHQEYKKQLKKNFLLNKETKDFLLNIGNSEGLSMPNLAFIVVTYVIKQSKEDEDFGEFGKEDIDKGIKKIFNDFY